MKEEPLISVIVPVYNVERYLRRCLDSIINQTYRNIEIILVDDGSTDDSGKICEEYAEKDKRITVIHKKNGGLSSARNAGITKAHGDYLTFVDSDDETMPDYVGFLLELIEKFNTKMSIAGYVVVTEHRGLSCTCEGEMSVFNTEEALRRMLMEEGFTVSACSKMYAKSLFDKVRYPDGKLFEDNATTHKLILLCPKIAYGGKNIYKYHIRENSLTTGSFSAGKMDYISSVDDAMAEIVKAFPSLKEECEARQVRARFSVLKDMLLSKNLNTEMKSEKTAIIKYLRSNFRRFYTNSAIEKRMKFSLLALKFSEALLKIGVMMYEKCK